MGSYVSERGDASPDTALALRAVRRVVGDGPALFVDALRGTAYVELPCTFVRAAWPDNDSYGVIGRANATRYAYACGLRWVDGGTWADGGAWGAYTAWATGAADGALDWGVVGHVVRAAGVGNVWEIDGLDGPAVFIACQYAHDGIGYAVRFDCWGRVEGLVRRTADYCCLDDMLAGEIEHCLKRRRFVALAEAAAAAAGVSPAAAVDDFVGVADALLVYVGHACDEWDVGSDCCVIERARNDGALRAALDLAAAAWVRGGVTWAGVWAAAEWAGALGDGADLGSALCGADAWGPASAVADASASEWDADLWGRILGD